MKKWIFVAVPLVCAAGCGSKDTNKNSRVCGQVRDKIAECHLNGVAACDQNTSDAVICSAQCLVDAQCAQITASAKNNPYYVCIAKCSGAAPGDFICYDGSGFLPKAGVCDGVRQCPDGSDESACAKPADAGTD